MLAAQNQQDDRAFSVNSINFGALNSEDPLVKNDLMIE